MQLNKARWAKIIPVVVGLASFLIYLRTLAPDVVEADGAEFQFAAWNFGFVHPTGYPLYLILGGLFQHLVPISNPAFRLNLFTAITASFAIAMLYLVVYEIIRHRGAAMIAVVSFALTRTFWYDANAAETYALNAFFIALLIYLALRWQANPTAKKFALFCFAYGLALTHHRTIILWIPAFFAFFLIVAHQEQFRFHPARIKSQVIVFALGVGLPLLLYLYIPLFAPVSPYATLSLAPGRDLVLYDNSLTGFVNYFLGRTFQSELRWDAVSLLRLESVPQLLIDQFGVVGVALGVVGSLMMFVRREWARLVVLLTGFIATILFAAFYHIGDIFHYYIPVYLVWGLWIGFAITSLLNLTLRFLPHGSRFVPAFCLLLTAFLLPGYQLIVNLPYADRSGETMPREHWTRLLATPAAQNAILISNDRDEMMPLWYMQYAENTRRDVLGLFPLITSAPEHANIARLTDSVLDAGRPVYFIKEMPGLEIKYRVEPAGALVRVFESAIKLPPPYSSNATLTSRLRIIGYDTKRESDTWHVAIYWRVIEKLESDYTTFVHLVDAGGKKIAQGNDHQVGGEFYPTSLWKIGETLRDEHVIQLPPNLAPGNYRLLVGMYRQPSGEMLGAPVVVGEVEIR